MFWFVSWYDFIGESSRLTCTQRVSMLREIFAGVLPAHPARMWVWKSVMVHYKEEGSEESQTLRDSYCMDKHFSYVYTERIRI